MSNDDCVLSLPDRAPAPAVAPDPALARAELQLAEAAHLIETVAYDLAGDITTDRVARLMLMAAEIERLAATLGRSTRFCPLRALP